MLTAVCVVGLLGPLPAGAIPDDSTFTKHRVPSRDGTMLDVDVIRAAGTPEDERQPVIMVVSPYTLPENDQPSSRFDDFFADSQALQQGYTYVIATLRSIGQSEGCSDWGGPGEQMDVDAAVEWAAAQPWSTGKVGLLGKSYDGWTGLMGMAHQPDGLAAVLSMEPVFDRYRYLYDDGIRFVNSALTPTSFMTEAQPLCAVEYIASQQDDDGNSAFWQQRELIKKSQGSTVQLFLTQGFLERNTKPDGAFAYWEGIAGPKRAWFGQFDHVRGTDRQGDEVPRRPRHLRRAGHGLLRRLPQGGPGRQGTLRRGAADRGPGLAGRLPWRGQLAAGRCGHPRHHAQRRRVPGQRPELRLPPGGVCHLADRPHHRPGRVVDLPAMPGVRRMTGEAVIDLDLVTTAPRSNVAADIYDIAPDGTATLVTRGADMIRLPGKQRHRLTMYGQDWVFAEGHRIGVLVSGSNAEWWVHVPTGGPVAVLEAFAELPILRDERTEFLVGDTTTRLRDHLGSARITVPAPVIELFYTPFDVG